MTYKEVNVHLTSYQIKKLRDAKRSGEAVILALKRNQVNAGNHTLYLTDRQINKLKSMPGTNARIELSKAQMKHQKGGFLGAIIPLVKAALPAIGKVFGTLGLAGATGAVQGLANKAVQGSGSKCGGYAAGLRLVLPKDDATILIKSVNELENKNIIPKGTTEMAVASMKEQNGGFLAPLLGTLAGLILPSLFKGNGVNGKGMYRAGQTASGLYRAKGLKKDGKKAMSKKPKLSKSKNF